MEKTTISYKRLPAGSVYWELNYTDGSSIHIFASSENGVEKNMRRAKKAAEHAQRLTEAALERKK